MEKLLETVATQTPGLVVLVILVRWFLAHMQGRDDFLKELHHEHMLARETSREALYENTKSNRDVILAMQEVRDMLRNFPLKEDKL